MKINVDTSARGKCVSCGEEGPKHFIQNKGKRKGQRFLDHSFYVKVHKQVSWFRGEDEFLGTFCKPCFKAKKYIPVQQP